MQFHMLALFSGISPLISSRKRAPFPSSFAKPFYRKHRLPSFRDTAFPVSRCQTLAILPLTKKIEGSARDDDTRRMRFPHTLSLHDARDIHSLHCHFERSREILLALCSSLPLSRKASNFTLSHIRRYTGVQERSLGFARDDVAEMAFPKHIRCTLRKINPFPPIPSFRAQREIFLALCSFLLPSQKVSHFPLSHIRRYTGVQERSRASLGMTIQE